MRTENNSSTLRALTLAVLSLALVAGCTKKKELTSKVDPNAYIAKSVFVGSTASPSGKLTSSPKLFHISRGVEEAASDNTVGATPGMSDDLGLVRARITEKNLFFELVFEPNGRPGTEKVVASFPIKDHFDIKRETNDFNEQTNKIVEDREKPWSQRAFIRVDWENPSNSVSNFANSLKDPYSGIKIAEETPGLLEAPVIDESGYMNFLVETYIKADESIKFVFPYSISTPTAYRVVYRTHFLPVKENDFEAVPYSLEDFQKFGYFFTQQNFENPEKGLQEKDVRIYANVHNVCEKGRPGSCSTNQIKWVLSKDFPDFYRDEAKKAVKAWDHSFRVALNRNGPKDAPVVVLDESFEANMSDPRYNVLAFYPSGTNAGLLGVAQWVSDPRSGEFVGVRATVYQDGINSTLGMIDTLIDILNSEDPIRDVLKADALGTTEGYASPLNGSAVSKAKTQNMLLGIDKFKTASYSPTAPKDIAANALTKMDGSADKANARLAKYISKVPELFAISDLKFLQDSENESGTLTNFAKTTGGVSIPNLQGMERLVFAGEKLKADKQRTMRDAARGIHGAELVEDAALRYLMNIVQKTGKAKFSDAERKQIKDAIAKETYYSTLLHEMGHAFGLRHNFRGSSDKANFHPEYKQLEKDLAAGKAGVTKSDLDHYAMSSIMDYGRDFYADTGGLGSYDNAAIKYAYNRSLDREKDEIVTHNYAFCTDHEVDETILCRRFDKGSNISEITAANVEYYNRTYPLMHYRRGRLSEGNYRGWGNPGALINNLLSRVFIPTRQVMDEFLYSLVGGEKVALDKQDGSYCDFKFVQDSLNPKRQEIADICTYEAMEKAGIDPTDTESFYNALINPATGQLYMDPSQYTPYGMADMLYSNLIARDFFQQIIGSTEPGKYLANPPAQGSAQGTPYTLIKLPDGYKTDEEALTAFAKDRGIEDAAGFIAAYKQYVTEVKVGSHGRQFDTIESRTAGRFKTEILGSFWDKYAAIIALSMRGIGIEKYEQADMSSNVYFSPLTKKYAAGLFGSLIDRKSTGNYMTAIPVVLDRQAKPVVVSAAADAAMSLDTQALASVYAFGYLTTTSDMSMLNKLRVCTSGEGGCEKGSEDHAVAEFSSNGRTYRAVQTYENDSIAYDLVVAAKKFYDARAAAEATAKGAGAAQMEALLKLDEAGDLRTRLDANLAKYPELEPLRKAVTDSAANSGSAWSYIVSITQNLKDVGYFSLAKDAETVLGLFAQATAVIDQEAAKAGQPAQRQADLNAIKTDLAAATKLLQEVVTSNLGAKAAPLLIKNNTTQLERAESTIIFLRELLKQQEH